jgi:hypothetical protein
MMRSHVHMIVDRHGKQNLEAVIRHIKYNFDKINPDLRNVSLMTASMDRYESRLRAGQRGRVVLAAFSSCCFK